MSKLKLESVGSKYGAQMGRQNILPANCAAPVKLSVVRLKWVDYDYDQGGAYWGRSKKNDYIYCAYGEDDEIQIRIYVRARSAGKAWQQVLKTLPNAIRSRGTGRVDATADIRRAAWAVVDGLINESDQVEEHIMGTVLEDRIRELKCFLMEYTGD